MVKLNEITNENLFDILKLKVLENQKEFVASNVMSLAEAFATRNEGGIALPFGIYDDEILIGFVMIGYNTVIEEDDPKIAKNNYVLWRLMLDYKYQGKGYAKKVLDVVIKYIKSFPCGEAEYCWLSYEPENIHGKLVYDKYGFIENGEMCYEEIVSVYKL